MNRGSFHTRSFRRIHFSVFRYRWTKGPGKRGNIVAGTLLPTQMFPRFPARNICCGHKFCVRDTKNVSDFVQKHFVSATNVSQFVCPQQCVLVYQGLKNAITGPKRFRGFRETGPRPVFFAECNNHGIQHWRLRHTAASCDNLVRQYIPMINSLIIS